MWITPIDNEKTFDKDFLLVTKTDLKGRITYANRNFMDIVDMDEDTLIGHPHNIVRHPDMPKIIFKLLWEYLQKGEEIHAYVKNLSADGSYYWVLANVTPSYDNSTKESKIIGYHSSRRFPKEQSLAIIKPLYAKLLDAEKSGGIDASKKIIDNLLQEKGISYDEFILSF
ncbi:MAG: PAS domain-containing protein [Campylobacterota bacterium]|nr:PAS domain-containing protein [Campylobacterota bacterium]